MVIETRVELEISGGWVNAETVVGKRTWQLEMDGRRSRLYLVEGVDRRDCPWPWRFYADDRPIAQGAAMNDDILDRLRVGPV